MLWAMVVIVHFHSTIKIHQHNRLREFVNRFTENQIQKELVCKQDLIVAFPVMQ